MAPAETRKTQALIVGGGPVGVFTALILARNGIEITLVEEREEVDMAPRSMAFQPSALAEMVEAGVYEDVYRDSVKNAVISWWKAGHGYNKQHLATISTTEGDQPFLTGLNCSQSDFTKIVLQHLRKEPTATVLFGHRITSIPHSSGESVRATVAKAGAQDAALDNVMEIEASWLIGADGGRSLVRAECGIAFEGFTWPKEQFVATNVYYPFDKYGFTNRNFIIDSVNWAVVAKINNDGLWRVAYGSKPGMTQDQILEELPERFKNFLPGPGEGYTVLQANSYRPHQRCAARFRKGRVILVGDAAHLNNPIGGLGLTTGILGAGPLARALSAVISGKAPESLLDRWEELRRKSWHEQTNKQSIEFKRIAQQGGHGADPDGIWKHDDVAEKNGMIAHMVNANPDAKEKDEALYRALQNPENGRAMRRRVWGLALPVDWMADYEDPDVVTRRGDLRPVEAPIRSGSN
ncbi:FAD binding domain-containing protein [Phialemonium atrogriseum]|uniref:FAD binding domain-containing protein n=1 Tax=Phialemonium atrogriseum TaxID=1093897 RepID=A0AAJ0BUB6_9PEZI|nr:FAD binding domain-containing protein [Phialemonium atrogriseum]KAK1763264.1 FAD binding domain-containing protein [Phialemonium atrogriseum]